MKWDIYNGPEANVEVEDMNDYSNYGNIDSFVKDRKYQQWSVKSWLPECTKLESAGCDILTAEISKTWTDWDSTEDADFNFGTYQVQLLSELNSIRDDYPS